MEHSIYYQWDSHSHILQLQNYSREQERHTNRNGLTLEAILFVIPVLLHGVGLYLLYVTRRRHRNQMQRQYLISLSMAEIVMCVMKITHRVCMLQGWHQLAFYCWLIQTTGGFLCYILVMSLLTLDRFLEVYLNLRYPLWCTVRRTRVALYVSKGLSLVLVIAFCSRYRFYEEMHTILALYFWPATQLTFLAVAVFTYSYVFVKIRRNRKQFAKIMKSVQRTRSETQIAVNRRRNFQRITKRFYVPSLLVMTFILFWIVPDMTEFVYMVIGKPISSRTSLVINICYVMAMLSDALIYVFSTVPVRRYLCKCLKQSGIYSLR